MKIPILCGLTVLTLASYGQNCVPEASLSHTGLYAELEAWADRLFEIEGQSYDSNANGRSDIADALRLVCLLDQAEPDETIAMENETDGYLHLTQEPFTCLSLWVEDNPTLERFEIFEEQLFDLPAGVTPSPMPPIVLRGPIGQRTYALVVDPACARAASAAYTPDGRVYRSRAGGEGFVFHIPYGVIVRLGDPGISASLSTRSAYAGERFTSSVLLRQSMDGPVTASLRAGPEGMVLSEVNGSLTLDWDVPAGLYEPVEAVLDLLQDGSIYEARLRIEVTDLAPVGKIGRSSTHLPGDFDLAGAGIFIFSDDGDRAVDIRDLAVSYAPILRLSDEGLFGVDLTEIGVTEYDYVPRRAEIALEAELVNEAYYALIPDSPISTDPDFTTLATEAANRPTELLYLDYRVEGGYPNTYKTLRQNGHPVTYYVSVRHGRRGDLYLTYWFFYYYNDWTFDHEGDWEFVQIKFVETDTIGGDIFMRPASMACSTHYTGYRRPWSSVQTYIEPGTVLPLHPVLYVANGGHGTYLYSRNEYHHVHGSLSDDHAGDKNWIIQGRVRGAGGDRNGFADLLVEDVIVLSDSGAGGFPLDFRGHWGEKGGVFSTNYNSGPEGPKFRLGQWIWKQPWNWHRGRAYPTPLWGTETVKSGHGIRWKGARPSGEMTFESRDDCLTRLELPPLDEPDRFVVYLTTGDGALEKIDGHGIGQWPMGLGGRRFFDIDFCNDYPDATSVSAFLVYSPDSQTTATHASPGVSGYATIDHDPGTIGYLHGTAVHERHPGIVHLVGDEDNFGFGAGGVDCAFFDNSDLVIDLGIFDLELNGGDEVVGWEHDFREDPRFGDGFVADSVLVEIRETFSDNVGSLLYIDGVEVPFVDQPACQSGCNCSPVVRSFYFTGEDAAFANDGMIQIVFSEQGDDIALDFSRVTINGGEFERKPRAENSRSHPEPRSYSPRRD